MFEIVAAMEAYQSARLETERRKRSHQRAMEAGPEALAAWELAEEKRKQDLLAARKLELREREVRALEELARQGRRSPATSAFGGAILGGIIGNAFFD